MLRHKKLIGLLVIILVIGAWQLSSILPFLEHGKAMDVWMLDVGQGESVLVREPDGKKLLFDGGPDDAVLSQLGAVLPFWDRSIDLVVLSHNHSDHISGLISVLSRYQVGGVWLSGAIENSAQFREFQRVIKERHTPVTLHYFDSESCKALICPIPYSFGQSSIQLYHPLEDMEGQNPANQHDATLSIKITYSQESVFLAGDLNEEHEQAMIEACQEPRCTLASTVLQVPHHGSATGLLPEFLAALQPKVALIPVGLGNKFHHPTSVVLTRLHEAHIPIYRTDRQGRIHLRLTSRGFTVDHQRN